MNPIIGMLVEIDNDSVTKVQNTYISSVAESGGIPFIIPYIENDDTLDQLIELCDGFLFTGGCDIHPRHYGEEVSPLCGSCQSYRDNLELKVFEKAIKSGKPIMGICRGCQLINVALGGTLYQDIPSELNTNILHRQTEPQNAPSHSVTIKSGTPLFELIGNDKMRANSFHHQAVKQTGKGLKPMAVADDGIIEALYCESEQYIRAYQWHPERLYTSERNNKLIFDDFICACGKEKLNG